MFLNPALSVRGERYEVVEGKTPNTNPGLLPIDTWFDSHFARGFPTPPISRTTVVVDGRSAVRIETSELGRTVHVYVPDNADVVEITYDLNNAAFVADYENMLKSLRIQTAAAAFAPGSFALASAKITNWVRFPLLPAVWTFDLPTGKRNTRAPINFD